jgi:LSD1 subclass zinc finger protein
MEKQIRLRRKNIEKPVELDEISDNISPIACTECGRKYEMVAGSSNARCANCNERYKLTLGGQDDWHISKWTKDG